MKQLPEMGSDELGAVRDGAAAFRAGKPVMACPHRANWLTVPWCQGWCTEEVMAGKVDEMLADVADLLPAPVPPL